MTPDGIVGIFEKFDFYEAMIIVLLMVLSGIGIAAWKVFKKILKDNREHNEELVKEGKKREEYIMEQCRIDKEEMSQRNEKLMGIVTETLPKITEGLVLVTNKMGDFTKEIEKISKSSEKTSQYIHEISTRMEYMQKDIDEIKSSK